MMNDNTCFEMPMLAAIFVIPRPYKVFVAVDAISRASMLGPGLALSVGLDHRHAAVLDHELRRLHEIVLGDANTTPDHLVHVCQNLRDERGGILDFDVVLLFDDLDQPVDGHPDNDPVSLNHRQHRLLLAHANLLRLLASWTCETRPPPE